MFVKSCHKSSYAILRAAIVNTINVLSWTIGVSTESNIDILIYSAICGNFATVSLRSFHNVHSGAFSESKVHAVWIFIKQLPLQMYPST